MVEKLAEFGSAPEIAFSAGEFEKYSKQIRDYALQILCKFRRVWYNIRTYSEVYTVSFVLATDTSCDIFRSELKSRGIEYRPLVYTIGDDAFPDEFSSAAQYKAFYDEIRAGKMPTTSQINIAEHEEFFTSLTRKYSEDILYITLSSGLSSTNASAVRAAQTVSENTGRNICVVDSLGATIAVRLVVDEAERLRNDGVSAVDAAKALEEFVAHIQTWFMPVDLMHLKRGGRVSGPAAYIGTALNIKPIIFINKTGGLTVTNKIHGVPKAMAFMADVFKRDSAEAPHKFYVASADSDYAEEMLKRAKSARPDCEGEIGWIGPVIGAHTGCGAVGISFVGNKLREI